MRYEFEFHLDSKSEIKLSDDCVVCHRQNPDSRVLIKNGWLDKRNPSEDIFSRHFFTFPCCRECRLKARASRAISGLATVAGIALAMGLMYVSFQIFPSASESNWVGVPLVLLCVLVGVFFIERLYSPIVVLSRLRSRLFLCFRDEEYARRFEELNESVVKRR